MAEITSKLSPCLWFDHNAQEAVDFYLSVFPDSKITSTTYYPMTPEEGLADFQLDMAGKVLTIEFDLLDMHFMALNAGPEFKFNEAISFVISCQDQAEIDYYWEKLSAVPEAEQCGWCKDKFGMSWQVTPANWEELLQRPGAFQKMMDMKKLEIDKF